MKQETMNKWKPIIDAYDPTKETVLSYCRSHDINIKTFNRNRLLIYGKKHSRNKSFKPVTVIPTVKDTSFKFTINNICVTTDSSIDDKSLKKIIKICSEL